MITTNMEQAAPEITLSLSIHNGEEIPLECRCKRCMEGVQSPDPTTKTECPSCHGRGVCPTAEGKALINFVKRWLPK